MKRYFQLSTLANEQEPATRPATGRMWIAVWLLTVLPAPLYLQHRSVKALHWHSRQSVRCCTANTARHTSPEPSAAGCTLPVEMFFPAEEYPTKAVEQELQQLGVMCSVLPDLVPTYAVNNSSKQLSDSEGKRLAGFSMKSAAVLLSSFEEVHRCFFECCGKMA